MDVRLSLSALAEMHPQLLWSNIAQAAAAVLTSQSETSEIELAFQYDNVPGFGNDRVMMGIDASGFAPDDLARLRRTYEPDHLVELAAIAVAGLALYHGGGHEIVDVSLRGTSADYLVDTSRQLLEVAGRSRRRDLASTWNGRRARLSERGAGEYFVCVVEFETPQGRLGFFDH